MSGKAMMVVVLLACVLAVHGEYVRRKVNRTDYNPMSGAESSQTGRLHSRKLRNCLCTHGHIWLGWCFIIAAHPIKTTTLRGLLGVNRLDPDAVMANNMRAQATTAQVPHVRAFGPAVVFSSNDSAFH
jgi:hypothetical protein